MPQGKKIPLGGKTGLLPDDIGEQDAFFRTVVENAADMISVIDTQGTFLYATPNAAKLFGVDMAETVALTENLFHPDDYPNVVAEFSELVVNGGSCQLSDHRMLSSTGDWVWIQTRAINLTDDPRVNGVVMVSRDITPQKRHEEETLRAEIAVKFGHWRWDKDASGPYWSDGMFAMIGLKRNDCHADMAWTLDLMPADDQELIGQIVTEALVSGASFNQVVDMRHADGENRRIMLMGNVERDGTGEPSTVVGICQDVTELESAHDSIKQSEEEFRLLAEYSTDAIARFDAVGKILYISPSVERILGYNPAWAINKYATDHLHPDDVDRVSREVGIMHDSRETLRTSFRMRAADGSYVWLETAMTPIFDADDNFEGFVACNRDVTEQKKHEQELMAARERAEQASLTKSRFLANMSHELRTPLNAILGFSEMMTQEVFGPIGVPQYEEYAGMIHESGAHLLSLIGDILDMSKIEAGKYDLALEQVDVVTAMQKATRMVQTRIREGDLDLILELDAVEGASVTADARALTQVMLNLLSNAVKFTPAGGRITVSAARTAAGNVTISIADTGVGIEPADLERVMHPFEQVVRHAELASQGTGLGLPLVRALVGLQDGSFSISSELGHGTVVNIELPGHPAKLVAGAAEAKRA